MENLTRKNDMGRPFIVFSNKLAAYLLFNNIKLLRVRPDAQDFSKNVYIFKNSSEIEPLIEDYNEQLSLE